MSSSESESESLPFKNLFAFVFGLSSPSDISSSSSDESSESESSSDESSSDEVSPVANMPPPPPDLAGLAAALSLEAAPSAGREPELETDSLSDESESSEREPEAKNDILGVEWGRGRGVQVGGRGREGGGGEEGGRGLRRRARSRFSRATRAKPGRAHDPTDGHRPSIPSHTGLPSSPLDTYICTESDSASIVLLFRVHLRRA